MHPAKIKKKMNRKVLLITSGLGLQRLSKRLSGESFYSLNQEINKGLDPKARHRLELTKTGGIKKVRAMK